MSTALGLKLPSGLVFSYDASNIRSFLGAATTNLITNPTPTSATGFTNSGGGGSLTYDSANLAVKWVKTSYETWGTYINFDPSFTSTLDTAAQYTISFEWRTENTAVANTVYTYGLVQGNGTSPAVTGISLISNSTLQDNDWYLFKYTFTPGNSGIGSAYNRILMASQGTNVSTMFIRKVQFEKLGFKSPFVVGTRSANLYDLVEGTTITPTSLVYNSDGSFSLNASSDYLSVASNSTLNFDTNSFSILFVTYKTGDLFQGGSYVNKGNATSTGFGTRDSAFYVHSALGQIARVDMAATLNTWEIYTFTFNQTTSPYLKRYVNGVLSQAGYVEDVTKLGSISNSNSFNVGYSFAGGQHRYFGGKIPLVQVYNKELSQSEVTQLYLSLRTRFGI